MELKVLRALSEKGGFQLLIEPIVELKEVRVVGGDHGSIILLIEPIVELKGDNQSISVHYLSLLIEPIVELKVVINGLRNGPDVLLIEPIVELKDVTGNNRFNSISTFNRTNSGIERIYLFRLMFLMDLLIEPIVELKVIKKN